MVVRARMVRRARALQLLHHCGRVNDTRPQVIGVVGPPRRAATRSPKMVLNGPPKAATIFVRNSSPN
ncbi:unnamed protein product, partial [Iphiclides podalirius]